MRPPLGLLVCLTAFIATAKPLKVYVLVGQSNMEGHARVETIDYIGDDPATAVAGLPSGPSMRFSSGAVAGSSPI